MTHVDDNIKSDFMLYPITMNMIDKLTILIWYRNVNLWRVLLYVKVLLLVLLLLLDLVNVILKVKLRLKVKVKVNTIKISITISNYI